MFTGIISSIGTIESSEQQGDLKIKVACDFAADSLHIGESIACNGVCLTVTHKGFLATGKVYFAADLSTESVNRTAAGQWQKGRKVNLERSLRMGDTLDGHMVSGHIDGIAYISAINPIGDSHQLELEVSPSLSRFIAEKGSVTLDGVSLTINSVKTNHFSVNIIPHTWTMTTLGERTAGDQLNIEIDLIARYVERLIVTRG